MTEEQIEEMKQKILQAFDNAEDYYFNGEDEESYISMSMFESNLDELLKDYK